MADEEHEETSFIGAPVEKFQSEPKPPALADWDATEETNEPETQASPQESQALPQDTEYEDAGFTPIATTAYVSTASAEEVLVTDDEFEVVVEEEVVEYTEEGAENVEDEEESVGGGDEEGMEHPDVEDASESDNEPFVATKEDLFGEDPEEKTQDLFAFGEGLEEETQDLFAALDAQDGQDSQSTPDFPQDPSVNDLGFSTASSANDANARSTGVPRDVELGIVQSRDTKAGSESRRIEEARRIRKERAAKTAKEDRTFHMFICFLIFLLIGGGVAVTLVFMLQDEEQK